MNMKEPEQQDHYRVLGLSYNSNSKEVKDAYYAAAKRDHPDKATPTKVLRSTKIFQKLQAAYETLRDADLRRDYNKKYPKIKAQWDAYDRHLQVSQAKRQKRERFTQEVINIHSKNDSFKAHAHILKDRSPFFKSHLERVGEDGIRFPDEDDVVAAYVHCVYHGEVQTDLSEAVCTTAEVSGDLAAVKVEYEFLAKLYGFGKKVQDDAFCDLVITTFAETIDKSRSLGGRTFPNCKIVSTIYAGTSSGSPARQMMVDLYAENSGKEWFPKHGYGYFPPEFTYDLVREVLVHKTQVPPHGRIADRCRQWHKKGKGKWRA